MKPQDTDAPDEPNPFFIFEMLNAHQRTATLRGAIELDLFTGIGEGQHTAAALAKWCAADARAMRILCDYLVVQRLLTKDGDRYELTPSSAMFLDQRSPKYLGTAARFINSHDQLDAFRDVAELVRGGRTLLKGEGSTETEYDGWVEFARSMVPLMMVPAAFIGKLAADRLTGPVRVLDIAAGHGMFGVSVAKALPEASIVALDWPAVLEVARENAAKAGIEARHSVLPGDAMQIDYGSGFDLVLITNFLHHFDRATCVSMMKKVRDCLNKDGTVFTLEFVPNEDRVTPRESATFSLTMLAMTPSGDAYTFDEYDAMFREAGLGESEMLDVPDSPQRVIITRR